MVVEIWSLLCNLSPIQSTHTQTHKARESSNADRYFFLKFALTDIFFILRLSQLTMPRTLKLILDKRRLFYLFVPGWGNLNIESAVDPTML